MFSIYSRGYSEDPSLRLVDMNWVRYDETRVADLEIWGEIDEKTPNPARSSMLVLEAVDDNGSYLIANNLIQIRFSSDGETYTEWGQSVQTPDFLPGMGYVDLQVENPNYSGVRGYATLQLYVSALDAYRGGVVVWGESPWDAFVWDGTQSGGELKSNNEPFIVRAFLMDDELQQLYENAGLSFSEE